MGVHVSVLRTWAGPCSPARWHSMTVEVRMGTTCRGKAAIRSATSSSRRAAPSWSPCRTSTRTSR